MFGLNWFELRLCCSAEYLEFQFCGEMGDESESTFAIGQRVHSVGDSRRIGTVKYVGPIQGYSGDWVGVDWDNGDGRNDGSVNGVRYFQAKSDNSASFVRPKNLAAGITLLEALVLRYRGESTKEEEGMPIVLNSILLNTIFQINGSSSESSLVQRDDE